MDLGAPVFPEGVACVSDRGWQAVARLSLTGWRLVDEVLKDETATLCAAVWID